MSAREDANRGNPSSPSTLSKGRSSSFMNNPVFKLVRFLGVWAWIMLTYPGMVLGAALRWFNPTFRARGVPNGSMPSDLIQVNWAAAVVWLSGVKVVVEGVNNLKGLQSRSSIIMANHASGLDPFILQGYGLVAPKYLFKRSLILQVPPVFLLAWAFGHIPINRSNRASAIESLHDAAKRIKKFNRSIAIFPEGTRSKDGQLLPFKRGPFHLADEVRVPIAPMYIEGAWDLFRPSSFSLLPDSGTVRLRVLPPIENTDNDTVDTLEKKVHQVFESAQAQRRPIPPPSPQWLSFGACLLLIGLAALEIRYLSSFFF